MGLWGCRIAPCSWILDLGLWDRSLLLDFGSWILDLGSWDWTVGLHRAIGLWDWSFASWDWLFGKIEDSPSSTQ
jgi:hypothetical protein